MTGGGGGPIIIRALLDSQRLTEEEHRKVCQIQENGGGVTLNAKDARVIGNIAEAICKRP